MSGTRLLVVIGTIARMGGAERQAMHFAEFLSKQEGTHLDVLTFEDGALRGEIENLGGSVHVVPYHDKWARARRTGSLASIARLIRYKTRSEALVPFGAPASKVVGLVWPWTNAPFAWWNQQDEGRGLGGTASEKRILQKMPCITSNSTVGRDFLASTYGLSPDAIFVYNNGTPLVQPDSPGAWRRKLDAGSRKIVTMVANITTFKDHETLLDAWSAVRDRYPNESKPMLVLAGGLRQRARVEALKTKAFDLGFSGEDVKFVGAVPDIPNLLADSDLLVHSSVTEGCPNAVCEGMAAGLAVVATDIPGCRQALGDVPEFLAAPRNPLALATRIIAFLDNDALRKEQGDRNRQRIASEFSVEGMNQFFLERILHGLGKRTSTPGSLS